MSTLSAAKRKFLEEEDRYKSKDKNKIKHGENSHHKKSKEKKAKKSKKKSKKKHKKSSSDSSSDSEDSDEWVEKTTASNDEATTSAASQREDWMSMMGTFKTFDREKTKAEEKPKEKKGQIETYIPSQSSRELNPYWKDNGTGLPSIGDRSSAFKKPSYDDDGHRSRGEDRKYERSHHHSQSSMSEYRSRNWRKREVKEEVGAEETEYHKNSPVDEPKSPQAETSPTSSNKSGYYMSDEEINKLGAKIVKAEIMGNAELVKELKARMESAREYRKLHPDEKPSKSERDLMLTITDAKGNSIPLRKSQSAGDGRSKGGKKTMETHSMSGERVRFFADDDKYSLKQMFQKEKFGNADDDKEEFAKAISKHKNPNDDLDDIFSERITKKVSAAKSDEREMHKAISQQQSIQKSLDDCERCVDSDRMNKHTMVTLGTKVYLALPDRMSLVDGHCILSTVSHVACSTMIDEDVWSEILSFRKALVRMFNSRNEDVVFFETAVNLNRYPHLAIHCVPLPRDVGDSASIYFKKAILECETEWSNNKKVIDLRGKDVRRGVPKGLPYFWVDFGMDPGFAHVIEDQQLFPRNFAQEIIGGMLDLDHKLWRKPHRENFEHQRKKVAKFSADWKQFNVNPVDDAK